MLWQADIFLLWNNALLDAADKIVAARMLGYWQRFAATGDPGGVGAEAWPVQPQHRASLVCTARTLDADADAGEDHRELFKRAAWAGDIRGRRQEGRNLLAPRSAWRPLSTLQVNPGSLYRCGKSD